MPACEDHPEFGFHTMSWSPATRRWEGEAFAATGKVKTGGMRRSPSPHTGRPPPDNENRSTASGIAVIHSALAASTAKLVKA